MAQPDDALIALYRDAYVELLERIAARSAAGRAVSYEAALLADIERILRQLDEGARAWIETQLPLAYQAGMAATLTQLTQMGLNPGTLRPSLVGIHRDAVAVLANNMLADLTEAHQLVGRRLQDVFRQAGIEAVARKVATGQTARQAKAQLQQALVDQGIVAFADSRGRQWRLDAYAEMVARTTTREATNLGRLNQGTELGYDLVEITTHSPTCDICAAYQGRVYSVSGRDRRYPALYETAFRHGFHSIHPNCGHVAVIYVEALADDPEGDRARSNAPFVDNRSIRERNAYAAAQERRRRARADRLQWERYMAVLPNDTPTLAGFRRMKRANSARYQELRALYREALRAISET